MQKSITLTFGNIPGPGSYWLGVGSDVVGGMGYVGEGTTAGANSWGADLTGSSGRADLTRLDDRIGGTFEFFAVAGQRNEMGGTRTVTDGFIDLPFGGSIPTIPENVGSTLSARLNGTFYNAWSATGVFINAEKSNFQLSTTTKDQTFSILLHGVTAPGTYPVSRVDPLHIMTAGHNGGDAEHCCWGDSGDTGSVVVTEVGPKRIRGTFSGTLAPNPQSPATSALVVTDGVFDIGMLN